jgi:O-methyltransferase
VEIQKLAAHATRLKRALVQITDTPLLRETSRAMLRACPTPIQTWLRVQHIKAHKGNGFDLVPENELTEVYRNAVLWLQEQEGTQPFGDYLEFGVFYGSSLMCMHRVLDEFGLTDVRLFGFDSWQGLPEHAADEDSGLWRAGDFRSDYETAQRYMTEQGVNWNRAHLIRGWYQDTLKPELRECHRIRRAGVIMIDCDLYSSAKHALEFCAPIIGDRAVILFDDWFAGDLAEKNLGEKRAFDEFLAAHPDLECEETDTYIPTAKVFRVRRRLPQLRTKSTEAALAAL